MSALFNMVTILVPDGPDTLEIYKLIHERKWRSHGAGTFDVQRGTVVPAFSVPDSLESITELIQKGQAK